MTKPSPLTDKQREKIVELHTQHGISITQLRTRYRCSQKTIVQVLAAANVTIKRDRRTYAEMADV